MFNLVTASNLLFLLPDPRQALLEMARLLPPGGQIVLLNPSERMSVAAATALADQRGLQGVARASLITWATRAEASSHWWEVDLADLFAASGLQMVETTLKVGPGLARFARGIPMDGCSAD
jgi:ubiquinone/menaquinone biosynthesis C-methylase UbiE